MIISVITNDTRSKQKLDIQCDKCLNKFVRAFSSQKKSFFIFKKDLCRSCSAQETKFRMPITNNHKEALKRGFSTRFPKLTIDCKCCQKSFEVPYRERTRIFCGRSCQAKSIIKDDSRKTSVCLICQKEFKHYGEKIVCGRKCLALYMSKARVNENNPNWVDREQLTKQECPCCNKIFTYVRANLHKGQRRLFCSLSCSNKMAGGRWIENKEDYYTSDLELEEILEYDSSPYPAGWEKVKKKILTRDNYECSLCQGKERLEVHHIDYIKQNCQEENLLTLCKRCHLITNHNRYFWTTVLNGLNSNSKIVPKGWGLEIHIVNNENYCLKYLVFFKGKKFSLHKHNLKRELFLCIWGAFECLLKDSGKEDLFRFKTGDKIQIEPKVEHQLQALTHSILLEVSTRDFPEDSIRIEKGD